MILSKSHDSFKITDQDASVGLRVLFITTRACPDEGFLVTGTDRRVAFDGYYSQNHSKSGVISPFCRHGNQAHCASIEPGSIPLVSLVSESSFLKKTESHAAQAQSRYVAEDDLELLVLLHPPPKFWEYSRAPPYAAYVGLGPDRVLLCKLSRHSSR